MMKVIKTKKRVVINFCVTHIGHGSELFRMRITEQERFDIAAKLADEMRMKAILNEIRDSGDGYGRLHLIIRKDLKNIKMQFQINFDRILDPSDMIVTIQH